MLKFFTITLSCLLFSIPVFSQNSINISHKLVAEEGVNFVSHGEYVYQLRVTDGKTEYVYYQDKVMNEIAGTEKATRIQQLLGSESQQYADLECECLSLWQLGNLYTLFELDNDSPRAAYSLRYHIIQL